MFAALGNEDDDVEGYVDERGEDINGIIETKNGYSKIQMTLDSGAADNALPLDMFPKLKTQTTGKERKFYDAGGNKLENKGENVVEFLTKAGHKQKVRWQVMNVVKPLLAMARFEQAGCELKFGKEGRFMHNPLTKEKIPVYVKNGTYKVDLWVKLDVVGPVFAGQGR